MGLNVDKIYICHWDKLTDRKKLMDKELLHNNITDVEWVTSFNTDELDSPSITNGYQKISNLSKPVISLLLKHCWIIKNAYDKGYDDILILEDDATFEEDFTNRFNRYKIQLPLDWDVCWVGSCCDLHVNQIEGINVYRTNTSRCTHCYILSKSGINKIIKYINNIDDAIDWYFNNMIFNLGLNNFWFEPALSLQNKQFTTTIQL